MPGNQDKSRSSEFLPSSGSFLKRYTGPQAAALAGVPYSRAVGYWRALGYTIPDTDAVDFSDSDVELVRMLTSHVDEGMVEEIEALQLIAVLGRAISQLARLQVEIVSEQMRRAPDSAAAATVLRRRLPEVQWLLSHLWHRRLDEAIQVVDPRSTPPPTATSGVGFADIVGFTALSRNLPELELIRIIARFEHMCIETVARRGGNVVKMLGDEVLFTAEDPISTASIAISLAHASRTDPDIPDLRVGASWGPIIRQFGDIFGTTVNLASRLTSLATPGTVLASPALAAELDNHPGFELTPLPATDIRGIGVIAPVAIDRPEPSIPTN